MRTTILILVTLVGCLAATLVAWDLAPHPAFANDQTDREQIQMMREQVQLMRRQTDSMEKMAKALERAYPAKD